MVVLLLYYFGLSNGAAFSLILDFTGAIALSSTSFIIPSLLFLVGGRPNSAKYSLTNLLAVAMLLFGLAVSITVPVFTVLNSK